MLEIKVMATAAFKETYVELAPQFERASGHNVVTTWASTNDIVARVTAGEMTDMAVMSAHAIDELMPVPGIDITGGLSKDIEEITTFSTGTHVDSRVTNAANALSAFFKDPAAHALIRSKGMEPA